LTKYALRKKKIHLKSRISRIFWISLFTI